MYLKLGNTNIKYNTDLNDFLIISEIIDSKISYEKPVFVRNGDELDIWFGKNFSSRNYFNELLKSGVTLYLFRPISIKKDDTYIDYDSYIEDENFYQSLDNIEDPKEEVLYKVYDSNGSFINNELNARYNKYIYYLNELVNILDLPQNLDLNTSESFENRDTLRINYKEYSGPTYSYPLFNKNFEEKITELELNENELLSNLPDLNRLNLGYNTLSYDITIGENSFNKLDNFTEYIIIPGKNKNNKMIWFNSGNGILPQVSPNYYNSVSEINIINKDKNIIIEEFINELRNLGYNIITKDNNIYSFTIYSNYSTECNYFYEIKDFSMIPNFEITQDLLSKLSKNSGRIEFMSKTTGFDEEKIKIIIEEINLNYYRVSIYKYDYSEIFEGSITDNLNRIDNLINNNSKLLYCRLIDYYLDDNGNQIKYTSVNSNRDSSLPIGEFILQRGKEEIYDTNNYWESLNILFNSDYSNFIDFFLVPNINNYIKDNIDINLGYFSEYIDFLNKANNSGCQFLIENSDTGWKYKEVTSLPNILEKKVVYIIRGELDKYYILNDNNEIVETNNPRLKNETGNDFVFNYTKDINNRLVYFYRNINILGNSRPGYYLFIKGLISNIFSYSTKEIIYYPPIDNPYDSSTSLEEKLIKCKSNYLVCNNLIYYYKNYQNGKDYYTTIWMRFCISKISRELEKHKWDYLSNRMIGGMISSISQTLLTITNSFSMIRSIEISDYSIDYPNSKLLLKLDTRVSDLVDNNISIDITLNYEK